MSSDSKYSKVQTYNKLVRDLIPQYLQSKKVPHKFHVANDQEYSKKLKQKLTEEVKEFLEEQSSKELADIIEVVYALASLIGSSPAEVEALRQQLASERGTFNNRIILEES